MSALPLSLGFFLLTLAKTPKIRFEYLFAIFVILVGFAVIAAGIKLLLDVKRFQEWPKARLLRPSVYRMKSTKVSTSPALYSSTRLREKSIQARGTTCRFPPNSLGLVVMPKGR
jgi:hypothetical protein